MVHKQEIVVWIKIPYQRCSFVRNDDNTFIIPAKLAEGTEDITWNEDPMLTTYIGRRIQCRDVCDMFSIDTFPCLQVSSMNRYRQEDVKPKLSRFAVKVYGKVEGMIQLTRDKRAIHIAVRVKEGKKLEGVTQLKKMEEMVFEQISERSRGTEVVVCYLSAKDLQKSDNLEDKVSVYTEDVIARVKENRTDLVNPRSLVPESVEGVTGEMEAGDTGTKFDRISKN